MDYKILSYLLFYPDEEYLANLKSLKENLNTEVENSNLRADVSDFIDKITTIDKYEAQSNYVAYFDSNPSLSLYLFDNVWGDSKERGQALVDLKELYEKHNFVIDNTKQLPDFIPLFLEFLSVINESEAKELLSETYELMNTLYLRHKKIDSIYSVVFKNLIKKMDKEITETDVKVLNAKEIDELWQEQEVVFSNKVN
ncbi:MAG: nitrate reductase molybdenum cofactor assembly chaperone [Alphaproteobacteria bacterium]|jgi:nitrate reductase delta subunit|nr:nitrate reductase molybdenum cofactor assembly chaperone [Alphaproteobacteria bacterium]